MARVQVARVHATVKGIPALRRQSLISVVCYYSLMIASKSNPIRPTHPNPGMNLAVGMTPVNIIPRCVVQREARGIPAEGFATPAR